MSFDEILTDQPTITEALQVHGSNPADILGVDLSGP
jgi:hypothetical protein